LLRNEAERYTDRIETERVNERTPMIEHIKRILIVDDEPEFLNSVKRHLGRENFSLDSASNGKEATKRIQDSVSKGAPFDLLITDLIMPEMGGVELLEWLKKTHPEISVLIVSGFNDGGATMEKIRPEMDAFAKKPLTPKDMIDLIAQMDQKRGCLTLNSS